MRLIPERTSDEALNFAVQAFLTRVVSGDMSLTHTWNGCWYYSQLGHGAWRDSKLVYGTPLEAIWHWYDDCYEPPDGAIA